MQGECCSANNIQTRPGVSTGRLEQDLKDETRAVLSANISEIRDCNSKSSYTSKGLYQRMRKQRGNLLSAIYATLEKQQEIRRRLPRTRGCVVKSDLDPLGAIKCYFNVCAQQGY